MSFLATLQFEVRTTGNDANGGGFDPTAGTPGTDYSQQDSPQVTYTDLVIDGTTNTKCTSAGTPFTSAHVGNVINITSGTGFTVQRVQIISVTSSTATCDKSLGTLSSTGGNGKLGGALLTLGAFITANTSNTADLATCHLKAGTYTLTTGITLGASWTGLNMKFIGFNSAHSDGGTRPLVTTATNSTKIFACYNAYYSFNNINFSNTAGTRADAIWSQSSNPGLECVNCTFDGFAVALNGDNGVGSPMSAYLRNCEIKNCTSDGIRMYYLLSVTGCWIHANGRDGIRAFGTPINSGFVISFSVISGNTGLGVNLNAGYLARILNCSIASNTSDGIGCQFPQYLEIENSIVYGNGGYGINSNSAGTAATQTTMLPVTSDYNAYGSNTSGDVHNYTKGAHDVSLSASPFTSSTDFSLNATAGGGTACKAVGFPGVAPFGTSTSLDLGAVQTTGGGGGGGSAAMVLSRVFTGF